MGELYSLVRHREGRLTDGLCHKNEKHGGVAQQLKLHRKQREQRAMLDALTKEAVILRKLLVITENDNRRDDYARLVATVDSKRLILSRQIEENRGQ